MIAAGIGARAAGWLAAKAWPIATIAGVAVSLWLGVMLIGEKATNRHLEAANGQLVDENKAAAVELERAHANIRTLTQALQELNGRVLALSQQGAALREQAAQDLARARSQTRAAEARAQVMLDYEPRGTDQCERMIDVDRQLLETLK